MYYAGLKCKQLILACGFFPYKKNLEKSSADWSYSDLTSKKALPTTNSTNKTVPVSTR
jgi:hypothetical protein